MTISFTYNEEDAIAWYRLYLTRTAKGKEAYQKWKNGVVFWYAFVPAVVVGAVWLKPQGMEWFFLAVVASWISGVVRFGLKFTSQYNIRVWGKDWIKKGYFTTYLVPLTITVTKEGFRCISFVGDSMTNWYAEHRFEEIDDHFYLFTSDDDFTQIPKRAFLAEADQVAFKNLVQQSIGAAPSWEAVATAIATDAAESKDWWRDQAKPDNETNAPS